MDRTCIQIISCPQSRIRKLSHFDWKERRIQGTSSIISALDFMGYLKFLFLSDGQEQDVVVGTISEKSSVLLAIGAVWEPFVAGKDLEVKLAAQKAYLEQSEFKIKTSHQEESPPKWRKQTTVNRFFAEKP